MDEQYIDDFINNMVKDAADPLKHYPNKPSIISDIHEQLLLCKTGLLSGHIKDEYTNKLLGHIFSLLKLKYGPVSYAAEFNAIYVDQRDGVAIDKVIEIINKVVLD